MRRQAQRGFTLIEIMIAASLAVVLIGGLILTTNNAFKQNRHATTQTRGQTTNQAITRQLTSDMRNANPSRSSGHAAGATCAILSTADKWISYCNTPDGASRAEAPASAVSTPAPNTPVSANGTLLTQPDGHITITLSGSQFLTRFQPAPEVVESQLAITSRIGGH